MKKLKSKQGMTLMEIMVSILILVLLVIGIGTGMDTGMRVYREATFEADAQSLSGMMNTALTDVLQYAENIKEVSLGEEGEIGFVFTNVEYGLWDVYVQTLDENGENDAGQVWLCSSKTGGKTPLVNSGAYPDLAVTMFKIEYVGPGAAEEGAAGTNGGYFDVEYVLFSETDATNLHAYELTVRHLNAES